MFSAILELTNKIEHYLFLKIKLFLRANFKLSKEVHSISV